MEESESEPELTPPVSCSEESSSDTESEEGMLSGEEEEDVATRALLAAIVHECRYNAPEQALSRHLRQDLERLPPEARRALLSRRVARGCAPLFLAAAAGNVPLVQYLLACGAPRDQHGRYRAPGDARTHRAGPLWVACVRGRLRVARALLDAGAPVDAPSDSGSTPLRSACFNSHAGVARLLLRRGADVTRANRHGGTCLVNAVQSAPLVRLLLAAGAPVDARDSAHKTALHHAVQEQRAESARALLAAGADPALRTRRGDSALRLAALRGAPALVAELVARASPQEAADALELLGATRLDQLHDPGAALHCWWRATSLRLEHVPPLGKRPLRPPPAALGHAREWSEHAELRARRHDADWLRTQALLVAYRVLGPQHPDTLQRLMYRGAAYVDAGRAGRALALWVWVLRLRTARGSLLAAEAALTLLAITRLLQRDRSQHEARRAGSAAEVLAWLSAPLEVAGRLVASGSATRRERAAWDRTLRCVVRLAGVAGAAGCGALADILRHDPRTHAARDSLLHLACARLAPARSSYFNEEAAARPAGGEGDGGAAARALLAAGARVEAHNAARATPLHVACQPRNHEPELVEMLLAAGAHLDRADGRGSRVTELLARDPRSRVRPLQHVTLCCLAARALLAAPDAPRRAAALPPALRDIVRLHAPPDTDL